MLTYRMRHGYIWVIINTKDKFILHVILAIDMSTHLVHVGFLVRMVSGVHFRFVQVCYHCQNRFRTGVFLFWKVIPVCSVSELQAALVNMRIVSNSLSAAPDGGILAGGWIQFQCAPDFNLSPFSGSLNVTCQATGSWTRFPICSWSTSLLTLFSPYILISPFLVHMYSIYSSLIWSSLLLL